MTWYWWLLAGIALSAGFTAIVCKVMRSVKSNEGPVNDYRRTRR